MSGTVERVDPAAVEARLDRVRDPELDRSIVELDYVDQIRVDGSDVLVRFSLPTAWCSPAFAWMMATDARDEVGSLSGVEDVRISLVDHMHDEEISRGVTEGRAFDDVFEDADDDVDAVRRTLDGKARLARQHRAVSSLLSAGLTPDQVVALRESDLRLDGDRALVSIDDGALVVAAPRGPMAQYVERARETGILGDGGRLFATPEGEPIPPEEFERIHRHTRLAATSMSGQAGICSALHEARYGDDRDE